MTRYIYLVSIIFSIIIAREPIDQSYFTVKNDRNECPQGYFEDCSNTENPCIDDTYDMWIGDGFCDDGSYQIDLRCYMHGYQNDIIIGGPGQMVDNPDDGDCNMANCEENGLGVTSNGLCIIADDEDDTQENIIEQEDGQAIKNVTASQRTDGSKLLDIYYDLEGLEPYTFYNVYPVILNSTGIDIPLSHCNGDVWHDMIPGVGKHMTCDLNFIWETFASSLSGEYNIKVIAEATAVSELPANFNMITINGNEVQTYINDEPTYLVDYDFEIMESEVTAAQYVQFIMDLTATATQVNNYDSVEGDSSIFRYRREFIFEDQSKLNIEYTNYPDGSWGQINGYAKAPTCDIVNPYQPQYTEEWWMALEPVSSEDNFPKLQFTTTGIGADDFNFIISEGKGNHPIVLLESFAIEAFAEFYGLRVPRIEEYVYIIEQQIQYLSGENQFSIFTEQSPSGVEYVNYQSAYQYYDFFYEDSDISEICGQETTMPASSGYQFNNGLYGILGNVTEFIKLEYYDDPSHSSLCYQNFKFGCSYDNETFNLEGYSGDPAEGFRCARRLPSNSE